MKLDVDPAVLRFARTLRIQLEELRCAVGRARGEELREALVDLREGARALNRLPPEALAALDARHYALLAAREYESLNQAGAERLRKWAQE